MGIYLYAHDYTKFSGFELYTSFFEPKQTVFFLYLTDVKKTT